jgi:hypothetical protein
VPSARPVVPSSPVRVTIFDKRFPMQLLYYSASDFRRELTIAILADA